jgi:hypothetical protein
LREMSRYFENLLRITIRSKPRFNQYPDEEGASL